MEDSRKKFSKPFSKKCVIDRNLFVSPDKPEGVVEAETFTGETQDCINDTCNPVCYDPDLGLLDGVFKKQACEDDEEDDSTGWSKVNRRSRSGLTDKDANATQGPAKLKLKKYQLNRRSKVKTAKF